VSVPSYRADNRSPGYGLTLVSQSSTSVLHSAECLSSSEPTTPEDVALHAARMLLDEIGRGGCVDSRHQWLVMLLMVLGKEDVGKCMMGDLTAHRWVPFSTELNVVSISCGICQPSLA
jgi:RNA 3'-terminal phosphate cyclase-like protein